MTSVWEHNTYGNPYNMVDLMVNYLELKCIRYGRSLSEKWDGYSSPKSDDPSSKHLLELYNVNDEMWERVLKVELTAIANSCGHDLQERKPFNYKIRQVSFGYRGHVLGVSFTIKPELF